MTSMSVECKLDKATRNKYAVYGYLRNHLHVDFPEVLKIYILLYFANRFRKSGECKVIDIDILYWFSMLLEDDKFNFDNPNFRQILELESSQKVQEMTLTKFVSDHFNPFYLETNRLYQKERKQEEYIYPEFMRRNTYSHYGDKMKELNKIKEFLNDAHYGDILICTSARINHGYNDYDFIIGCNAKEELSFYLYNDDESMIWKEIQDNVPMGYHLNYYEKVDKLINMYRGFVFNRDEDQVEINFIAQILQKYGHISQKQTDIILELSGHI